MDLASILTTISIAAIPVVFAITVHEVAHGWVAKYFGDRTAEAQGRLSLNPIRHVDPIGTLLVPAVLLLSNSGFLFGWAKPVPVNPRFMRSPRGNMVWVSAAGPGANLGMAIIWAFLMMLSMRVDFGIASQWLGAMAGYGIAFNVMLAVFNMLPIPPLGWRAGPDQSASAGPVQQPARKNRTFRFIHRPGAHVCETSRAIGQRSGRNS